MSETQNEFAYKNKLIFDLNCHSDLQDLTTSEITDALEDSVISDGKLLVGEIRNVSHRNASLFYGDLYLYREYPKDCCIKHQFVEINLLYKPFKIDKPFTITSYLSDYDE